jgi:hypothetical protein
MLRFPSITFWKDKLADITIKPQIDLVCMLFPSWLARTILSSMSSTHIFTIRLTIERCKNWDVKEDYKFYFTVKLSQEY